MKPLSERGEEDFGLLVAVIILLFFSRILCGQEVKDLGIVYSDDALILEHATNSRSFVSFEVELQAPASTPVTLVRTNEVLTLEDLGAMPDGPVAMGVRSVLSNGKRSPMALFRLEISRTGPGSPRVKVLQIGTRTNHATLQEALQSRKVARTNSVGSAPMPGSVASGSGKSSIDLPPMGTPSGGAMRGGSNETYSEHMAKMAEYFKQKTRK